MRIKREHTRFDLIDIQGKMTLVNKVELVDISLGGVGLKVDKRLEVGREYLIRLGDKEHGLDVRGVIVRFTLIGSEAGADGESVLIYSAGMKFKAGSEDKITAFLNSVEHRTKEETSPMAERRLDARFQINAPREKIMVFPSNFRVKDITSGSMLIHSDQPLQKESMVPIELYLNEDDHLNLMGKVFSSRKMEDREPATYEIEMTYADLAEKDQALLQKIKDYLATQH
ncbi:MAG: PilZ domain-containing protein [Nitrospirae bacterium]|nr:PilZ domain-containing protein [Nitrospirota bacterium]